MPEYNPFSLSGKTILVTGASSGIGREIAIQCSKMGASVVLTARNEGRLKETLSLCTGNENTMISADLTNEADVSELVESLEKLDGVVLCAGKGAIIPFAFTSRVKFDDIFNINFFSPIELLRLLTKKKKLKNNASVVFIVSIAGTGRYTVGNSIYGASKAALQAMIHYCAQELSGKFIRVNGICPGVTDTPFIHSGTLTEEQMQADIEQFPLKRYGKPEDIAYGAIYLLSEASSWVTGHSLVIDGGITTK